MYFDRKFDYDMISKKDLSEQDIRAKYITPAIENAGWNKMTQLGEDVALTDGKIFIRGKLFARGKLKRADYVLYYKPNIPIAIIEDREYNIRDYDRNLVIDERTEIVARKLTEYLRKNDRFAKAIIFCVDIDHAERMAEALRNENQDLVTKNAKYVMQITGDNEEGKRELHPFQNEESRYPVLVTTSKMLTTGVDAPTCKLIVLDANIGSMTEFKQIIGRGTRLSPEFGKYFFTIIDFRNNASKFSDPESDGPPIQDERFGEDDEIDVPEPDNTDQTDDENEEPNPEDFQDTNPDPDNETGGGEIGDPPPRKIYVNDMKSGF